MEVGYRWIVKGNVPVFTETHKGSIDGSFFEKLRIALDQRKTQEHENRETQKPL